MRARSAGATRQATERPERRRTRASGDTPVGSRRGERREGGSKAEASAPVGTGAWADGRNSPLRRAPAKATRPDETLSIRRQRATCATPLTGAGRQPVMILPQVHLRKPCYDFYFL